MSYIEEIGLVRDIDADLMGIKKVSLFNHDDLLRHK